VADRWSGYALRASVWVVFTMWSLVLLKSQDVTQYDTIYQHVSEVNTK